MGLSAFFNSTIGGSGGGVMLNPSTTQFIQMVQADGGTVFSQQAINEAYSTASWWSLDPTVTHWSSPQFACKLDGNGNVIKRYCLFGNHATPQYAGDSWTLVPGSSGKAPQMKVTPGVGFVVPAFQWLNQILTLSAVVTQSSYSTTAGYPFFPIVELSADWNSSPRTFLLGIDSGAGSPGNFGGVNGPVNYAVDNTGNYNTLDAMQSWSLLVTNTSDSYLEQVRLFVNANQITSYAGGNSISGSNLANFATEPVYIGIRGGANQYYWAGNINDVFFTNKTLNADAINWLESQKNKY